MFTRPNSRIFSPEYVTRSERFFERFGAPAIVLARFVPVIRTVSTVLAGVSRMKFGRYALFSIVGAILWADGVFMIGYGLGKVTYVQQHQKTITSLIDPIIIAVVVVSILPVAIHWFRGRKRADLSG